MVTTKVDLRRTAVARREALPRDARDAFATRIARLGPRLVHDYAPANDTLAVSLFSAVNDEPDLRPLAEALAAARVPCGLPVTGPKGERLTFRRWRPGEPLEPGPMGIGEPAASAGEVEPDVLFVPLAVFDRRGYRIGYGGGFYDRTLAALRARKRVCAIGVAYAVQETLFVPAEPHDEPLDLILTERETILCGV